MSENPDIHPTDEDQSLHLIEHKSLAGDPEAVEAPAWGIRHPALTQSRFLERARRGSWIRNNLIKMDPSTVNRLPLVRSECEFRDD
jgi:hypothetical protein